MTLRADDWVEVRSKAEILRSLDNKGCLEGLPFMPQMFEYCGRRFKIFKRAHKTCDTVNPPGSRRINSAVHLELRCDGKAYGGCQAACLIFWKEVWLKPVKDNSVQSDSESCRSGSMVNQVGCLEDDVRQATCVRNSQTGGETRYACQATQLPYFTTPLAWWDIRQYVEDYVSGNVTFRRIFCGLVYLSYYHLLAKRGNKVGHIARRLYDGFQALVGGVPFPRRSGSVPSGQPDPIVNLNLQTGEFVRIKSYKEILATLKGVKNRGMSWDAELVPYCGGVYRVQARVTNFIDEKTGKMSTLKTPAVILEDVCCRSRYSNARMFCPRSICAWWREIWLERVSEEATNESPPRTSWITPGESQKTTRSQQD
jgi:hypothetical protein